MIFSPFLFMYLFQIHSSKWNGHNYDTWAIQFFATMIVLHIVFHCRDGIEPLPLPVMERRLRGDSPCCSIVGQFLY